ncbi:MAG: response regulator transcription factor [Planctomycetota bacterium]
MHQVAQRSVNDYSYDMSPTSRTTIVIVAANTLDAELISSCLRIEDNIDVLSATCDPDFGLVRCQRLNPDVLIIDPKIANDFVSRCIAKLRSRTFRHLLVLDDRLHESRLASLLTVPGVSYFTRQISIETFQEGLAQIASTGQRAFDPELARHLEKVGNVLRLADSPKPNAVALLTGRELEVMKLLASGYSVRKCAERLGLAESTVDNHKSRLMKKLDIHKIVELTHVAIREGLIVV